MKCPECDGTGKVVHPMMSMNGDEYTGEWEQHECEVCGGTGEIEVHMTNEEWFDGLSAKEKAEALENITRSVLVQRPPMCHDVCNREFWETWLKQPHR